MRPVIILVISHIRCDRKQIWSCYQWTSCRGCCIEFHNHLIGFHSLLFYFPSYYSTRFHIYSPYQHSKSHLLFIRALFFLIFFLFLLNFNKTIPFVFFFFPLKNRFTFLLSLNDADFKYCMTPFLYVFLLECFDDSSLQSFSKDCTD